MLTARYTGPQTIDVADLSPVPPQAGEVQIRVAFNGICGTDLHIFHGAMDARVTRPAVLGHEMSGTVAALGADVQSWAIGDPVTVMPLIWDGSCPACLDGNSHICQNLEFVGIDSPGAMQGLWNVPASVIVPLPRSLRLDHAALVEPVAVAVHDVRRSEIRAGKSAVVIGGGPIGVLIATVAREAGARVVVVELDPSRRSSVAELGFETLDPSADNLVDWVTEWTEGAGADVVFEVSGAAAAVLSATSLAKVRGTVVVVAIHPQPKPVDLQRVFWRELRILGARVYERSDFEEAIRLLDTGAVPAEHLITNIVPVSRTEEAFRMLEEGHAMKVLIDLQSEEVNV